VGLTGRGGSVGLLVAWEEDRGTLALSCARAHTERAGPAKKGGRKHKEAGCPNHLFMSQMTFLFHFPCPEKS